LENLKQLGQITEIPTSKNAGVLEMISNPSPGQKYNIKLVSSEYTSLCPVTGQPDFGEIEINYIPSDVIVETKSLKMYLQQYRDLIISYERLINVLYDDMLKVYKPKRLRIILDCNPRGGISSRLTQDSDWKSLGGKEEYKNYTEDVW